MTLSIVGAIAGVLSLVLNLIVFLYAHRTRTLSAQAQIELMVAGHILSGRQKYLERQERQLQLLNENSSSELDKLQTLLVQETAVAYCNAIEVLCSLYLDNKIDRSRIKKSYASTILSLIKDDYFSQFYVKPKTGFNATLKVAEMWDHGTE